MYDPWPARLRSGLYPSGREPRGLSAACGVRIFRGTSSPLPVVQTHRKRRIQCLPD